jgi:hypothetical protein
MFCTYFLHQGRFRAAAVHVAAWDSERLIGFYSLRQIYFICKFSHAKFKTNVEMRAIRFVLLRHLCADAQDCILDTAVIETSTIIKTKDTCFGIPEPEVAPVDNWLEFKICFPISTF